MVSIPRIQRHKHVVSQLLLDLSHLVHTQIKNCARVSTYVLAYSIRVCIYILIDVEACACMHRSVYLHLPKQVYVRMYVLACIGVCTRPHESGTIYLHMYILTYMHTFSTYVHTFMCVSSISYVCSDLPGYGGPATS